MIEERYCSYEVARLLREKGFDEDCHCWYEDEGNLVHTNDDYGLQTNSDHVSSYFEYAAPTHQMACDWLREVHHICITIYPDKEKGFEAVLYDTKSDVEIILQSFGIFGYHIFESSYEEAVERAKDYFKANQKIGELEENDILSDIFPELGESEDEKMRKSIIYALRNGGFYDNDKTDEAIAWLEKQGQNNSQVALPPFTFDDILALQCCMETVKKVQEDKDLYEKLKDLHGRLYDAYQLETQNDNADKVEQKDYNSIDPHFGKFINKVEPKFKVGDWVVENKPNNYARFIQILGIVDVQGKDRYGISRDIHNDEDIVDFDFVEKYYHIFDIQDAKDGDVLYSLDSNQPFIYKERKLNAQATAYCGLNIYGKFFVWDTKDCVITLSNYVPATKEQSNLLFAKMKEAGYEWDANKKELKEL